MNTKQIPADRDARQPLQRFVGRLGWRANIMRNPDGIPKMGYPPGKALLPKGRLRALWNQHELATSEGITLKYWQRVTDHQIEDHLYRGKALPRPKFCELGIRLGLKRARADLGNAIRRSFDRIRSEERL